VGQNQCLVARAGKFLCRRQDFASIVAAIGVVSL
jgi:hypothetical protein